MQFFVVEKSHRVAAAGDIPMAYRTVQNLGRARHASRPLAGEPILDEEAFSASIIVSFPTHPEESCTANR
jgi:hypothetical protein